MAVIIKELTVNHEKAKVVNFNKLKVQVLALWIILESVIYFLGNVIVFVYEKIAMEESNLVTYFFVLVLVIVDTGSGKHVLQNSEDLRDFSKQFF